MANLICPTYDKENKHWKLVKVLMTKHGDLIEKMGTTNEDKLIKTIKDEQMEVLSMLKSLVPKQNRVDSNGNDHSLNADSNLKNPALEKLKI